MLESLFNKAAAVAAATLSKRDSKFGKFHRETPVLESLFNNVAAVAAATLSKRDFSTGIFL